MNNKTYTMNNEVRNSFRRMLKDIAQNADLKWNETNVDDMITFEVEGNENVIALIDKFNSKMDTVRMVVRAQSKFAKKLEKIADKLNGKLMVGSQKDYFIIVLDRSNQGVLQEMITAKGIKGAVSCEGVAY